jgi:hypothetical protein
MTSFCGHDDEPCGKCFDCLSPSIMTLIYVIHSSICDVICCNVSCCCHFHGMVTVISFDRQTDGWTRWIHKYAVRVIQFDCEQTGPISRNDISYEVSFLTEPSIFYSPHILLLPVSVSISNVHFLIMCWCRSGEMTLTFLRLQLSRRDPNSSPELRNKFSCRNIVLRSNH